MPDRTIRATAPAGGVIARKFEGWSDELRQEFVEKESDLAWQQQAIKGDLS